MTNEFLVVVQSIFCYTTWQLSFHLAYCMETTVELRRSSRQGKRGFSILQTVLTAAHAVSYLLDIWGSFPRDKAADKSPLPSAELKNEYSHKSAPPYAFITCTGT